MHRASGIFVDGQEYPWDKSRQIFQKSFYKVGGVSLKIVTETAGSYRKCDLNSFRAEGLDSALVKFRRVGFCCWGVNWAFWAKLYALELRISKEQANTLQESNRQSAGYE